MTAEIAAFQGRLNELYLQPRSRGFPAGVSRPALLALGYRMTQEQRTTTGYTSALQRAYPIGFSFCPLHRGNCFQTHNRRFFFVMFLLIADVVYHPFQILRAETNDAIAPSANPILCDLRVRD